MIWRVYMDQLLTADIHRPTSRHCAFCKHWNDRQDKHIKHKIHDIWYYEPYVREYCAKKQLETKGIGCCQNYESKF